MLRKIIVVSRQRVIHEVAKEIAHEALLTDEPSEVARLVAQVAPDLTLFDDRVAPDQLRDCVDGIRNVSAARPVIVVTSSESSPFSAQDYLRAGASYHLSPDELVTRFRDTAPQEQAAANSSNAPASFQEEYFLDADAATVAMVGHSQAIRDNLKMIRLVAESHCNPILILGETGTGKEVAARATHSLRHPDKPFVDVNCAALTATLLESELFGHVRGAFTGADRDKTGLMELAGSGTIFLDEISEMPLELQAKLLRVLQERRFRKVGGVKDIICHATIIASSNRDLKREVREKRFRQDLYYRLNICPITLSSLRSPDRKEDIRRLALYFVETSTICRNKKAIASVTPLALEALQRHDWPGNVRELRNVIERAILLETTDKIGLSSIVIEPVSDDAGPSGPSTGRIRDFSLEKAERELIARALQETDWQKTQAASLLGITRATLYAKVKQYNIQKEIPRTGTSHAESSTLHFAEPFTVQ
jgi:transcriptional regulator with PAS, ATPase and Fis domain